MMFKLRTSSSSYYSLGDNVKISNKYPNIPELFKFSDELEYDSTNRPYKWVGGIILNSLEDIVKLTESVGQPIILDGTEIEIYDNYRE